MIGNDTTVGNSESVSRLYIGQKCLITKLDFLCREPTNALPKVRRVHIRWAENGFGFNFHQLLQVFNMGVCRNFSRGEQIRHFYLSFSGCWRCNANGRTQNASPFYTTKKMPNVTAAVAYGVFPQRKFYTQQMFVLVSIDILRMS